MKAKHAARIRHGVLTARLDFEQERLTSLQRDFLVRHRGPMVGIAGKSYQRENLARFRRFLHANAKCWQAARDRSFVPGDLVLIDNITDQVCGEFNGRHGVVTHGPDQDGGWLVSSAGSGLRCVAEELTLITPREDR